MFQFIFEYKFLHSLKTSLNHFENVIVIWFTSLCCQLSRFANLWFYFHQCRSELVYPEYL